MSEINSPISWIVSALPQPSEKITGEKKDPFHIAFDDKDKALEYKNDLQNKGWIATVTPKYLSPQRRGMVRAKAQERVAPEGFSKDWRLT